MIGFQRVQRMIRRHPVQPRWGWDYERPLDVHGFDVQFGHEGLRLELLGANGVVARALLPFGEVPAPGEPVVDVPRAPGHDHSPGAQEHE